MTVQVPSLPEPVPSSTDPTNFDERADALLSALPAVVAAQNLQNVENNTLNAAVVLQAAAAAADRAQTGLDRAAAALSKTGSAVDKVATAEDRAQTALDRTAAALSKTGTGTDAVATAADKVATAADRAQTGLDRTQTGLDRIAAALSKTGTAADLVQTALDRTAAALSKTGSAADVVVTGQDRAQTGQDRTQTGLDRTAANASANTASTKAAEAAASAASALAHKNAAATSEVNSATSATEAEAARVAALAASVTAVDVVAAASAAIEGASAIEANVLASQTNSEAAWAAMLAAINYLATAQELLSVPSTNLAINILGSAIMKSGSVFYSVEYGVPVQYTIPAGSFTWTVAATAEATGITSVFLSGSGIPIRAKGKIYLYGSGNSDKVFVEPGSYVDATRAGLGVDEVYVQGNFEEYVIARAVTTISLTRTLVSGEVEFVQVAANTGGNNDKLVFKNGYVMTNAVIGGAPTAANLDTSLVTPATFPANAVLVDTKSPTDVLLCNGAAVSRTDYPFLFARIGTRFGVGNGSTTFNLPTIPSLATGVPAYIKA